MGSRSRIVYPRGTPSIPEAPGVYTLWGPGSTPLYVGNSIVNMRHRVGYHLRHKSFGRVGSVISVDSQEVRNIGSIVPLEAKLIWELSPVYNVRGKEKAARLSRASLEASPPGCELPGEVPFVSRLTSLGRARDRWCITVPLDVLRVIDKRRTFQVTIRPLGSLREA